MLIKSVFILFQLYVIKLYHCVKTYDNYTLFRAIPVSEEQIKYLEDLPMKYDVEVWKEPGTILKAVDFTISPVDKKTFLREANGSQLYLTTIHSDVQKLFNQQSVKTYIRRQMSTFDWNNYYRLDDIYDWLRDLASLYPEVMKVFSIGTTVQNRKILAVKILHEGSKDRSTVIVEGGIHAREWISPAFVTFLINKLAHAQEDEDEDFRKIALSYNWVIVPVINPDGYEFTHKENRLWRKNCNKSGVDINRNFDVAFGTVGVSWKENSNVYCGPKAFSEKESLAMAELVDKYKDKLQYYLAFHSYGQYMIIPYAYKKDHVENFYQVKKMGQEMIKNIKKRYGTTYIVGTAFDTVGYTSSGVSSCWVKKKYKTPYVFTMELRDEGMEGFALSPKHIIPTSMETIDGLISFLNPVKPKNLEYIPLNNRSRNNCFKNVTLLVNFIAFIILCFDYLVCFFSMPHPKEPNIK